GVGRRLAAGLGAVGVAGEEAVRAGFDRLIGRAEANSTPARGVLVEAMASGVEVICGMRHDPVFGPVVLLGVGGTLTEVLKEVSVRVAPVAAEDLDEMLEECVVGRMLDIARADPQPLKDTLAALSRLAAARP